MSVTIDLMTTASRPMAVCLACQHSLRATPPWPPYSCSQQVAGQRCGCDHSWIESGTTR